MVELSNKSSTKEVATYIGECIDLYPKESSSAEVAYTIVGLRRFDWDHALAVKYDSYNNLATLVVDMEWQEQPGDWDKLVDYYRQFKAEAMR